MIGPGEACPTPQVRRLVVVTGAGMSADAGLPTFRGPNGLYENMDAPPVHTTDLIDRPEAVSEFVRDIRQRSQATEPHRGHHALTRCQHDLIAHGGDLTLLTMNIDDLHERAGASALHLYGRAWQERCTECDYQADADRTRGACPSCGAGVRPDIVLFGEPTNAEASSRAKRALRNAEAFYVIGSSGVATSIDRWLLAARRDYGIPTILITKNPEMPFIELFDIVIDDCGERLDCYLPSVASRPSQPAGRR